MAADEAVAAAGGGRTIADFLNHSGAGASTLRTLGSHLRTMEGWVQARHDGGPAVSLAAASERDLEYLKSHHLRKMKAGPHYAAVARMFFRFAKRADAADLMKLKQRGSKLKPDEILTLEEVNRLIRAATSTRDRALIAVLWETGVRIHELLAVDLENVRQRADGTGYHLWFGKVKVAGEEHEGYVYEGAGHLRAWLDAYSPGPKENDAPLFPGYSGRRLDPDSAALMLKRAAKRAGIVKRIYPHLFRHSRATHLLRMGVSEANVKRMLGWTPGSTQLSRYSHLAGRDAERAYRKALGLEDVVEDAPAKLIQPEADMAAVVPIVPPPGTPAPRLSANEIAELMADPNVQHFLRLLETARRPAPA